MLPVVLGALSLPVMLLNFFGGIVGGIWLVVVGQWGLIGLGILSMFISSFGLGLVLAVGLVFSAPAAVAFEKGKGAIGIVLALIGNLWTTAVMTLWCVGSFYVCLRYYHRGSIFPYLLWAYGMATGPWTYMAAREGRDAIASSLSAFAACIGAIAIMGTVLLKSEPTVVDAAIAFGIPILATLVLQVWLAISAMKDERRNLDVAA